MDRNRTSWKCLIMVEVGREEADPATVKRTPRSYLTKCSMLVGAILAWGPHGSCHLYVQDMRNTRGLD